MRTKFKFPIRFDVNEIYLPNTADTINRLCRDLINELKERNIKAEQIPTGDTLQGDYIQTLSGDKKINFLTPYFDNENRIHISKSGLTICLPFMKTLGVFVQRDQLNKFGWSDNEKIETRYMKLPHSDLTYPTKKAFSRLAKDISLKLIQ